MLYPLLTVAAGLLMTVISVFSLRRCIIEGGMFVNQIRFLVSGLLLMAFFPLQDLSTGFLLNYIEPLNAGEDAFTLAYWLSIALHVTVQVIIQPTQRELYSTYMADQLARTTGSMRGNFQSNSNGQGSGFQRD